MRPTHRAVATRPFNVSRRTRPSSHLFASSRAPRPTRCPAHQRPRSPQIEQLLSGVIIPEDEVREICEKTKEVLSKEENVVPVRAPVTVVRAREPNQFTHAFHFPSICPFNPRL